MTATLFKCLLVLLLPFGWADDLFLVSQTADRCDDCCAADNDVYVAREGARETAEPAARPGPSEVAPVTSPVREELGRLGRSVPAGGRFLSATSRLHVLCSLVC